MKRTILFLLFLVLLLTTVCKERSRFELKSFDRPVEVSISRFDLDFMDMDTAHIDLEMLSLKQKHPLIYDYFMEEALMLQSADTAYNRSLIANYISDSLFIGVHQKVKEVFADIEPLEEELSVAASYLAHYFPDIYMPQLFMMVSGFNHSLIGNDSLVGIGSDMYLGNDYPLYADVTHEYLIKNMRSEQVSVEVMMHVLRNNFDINNSLNLLHAILFEGKLLYLLQVILPEKSDAELMGYLTEEIEWSQKHEKQVWSSIMENKHLYSTDGLLISKYLQPAPFTSPITQESPGELGRWMGWRIIQAYMKNNSQVTLSALMQNNNYRQILERSGYRP